MDVLTVFPLTAVVVVFVGVLVQCLICPLLAVSKGKDGPAWFMISLMWTLMTGGALGAAAALGILYTFAIGESEEDLNVRGAAAAGSIAVVGTLLVIQFLPTLALLFSRRPIEYKPREKVSRSKKPWREIQR
jgi:hypothetical protein